MKFLITTAAGIALVAIAGCASAPAVNPAAVPACTTAAVLEATPTPSAAVATAPAPATATPRPVFVRPVVPPLPAELYPSANPRPMPSKSVSYGSDSIAAMLESIPDKDVFLAGGDTYFWHKDPHGHRERVFYGHGDHRKEIAQRRTSAVNRVAESVKTKSE